jgi:hypothetical protein
LERQFAQRPAYRAGGPVTLLRGRVDGRPVDRDQGELRRDEERVRAGQQRERQQREGGQQDVDESDGTVTWT